MALPDPETDPETEPTRLRLVRLRAEVGALHVAEQAGSGSSGTRTGPDTTEHWQQGRRRMREAVLADDLATSLTWPVLRDTVLVNGERHPYLGEELAVLQADPDWERRWRPAVLEDPVGSPLPLPGLPEASANRVHHAYQFRLLERATGVAVQDRRAVVEFGGGYGAMCAVAHRLGFAGTYVVHDLPEWSALQRWYVESLGLPVLDAAAPLGTPGVRLTSTEEDLRAVLDATGEDDLFVAMWSISETPLALRERVLGGVTGPGSWLLGYQARFEGIDNEAWVEQLRRERPEVDWQGGDPEPFSGNRYVLGARRR